MSSMLAPAVLRYVGICFCSPHCVHGPPRGAGVGAVAMSNAVVKVVPKVVPKAVPKAVPKVMLQAMSVQAPCPSPHGAAYRHYSNVCTFLAGVLTLATFFTLCVDCESFQELTDGFINFCSLYTTWVYIRVWLSRSAELHFMLTSHQRFLDTCENQWRTDPVQSRLLRAMYRMDTMFTVSLLATILGLVALVIMQACLTLVLPLPPVPRLAYVPPPVKGETDPIAETRQLRFGLFLAFQSLALVCCGVPFSCLTAIHFSLNTHGIYLMRCVKRSLDLMAESDSDLDSARRWRGPMDVAIRQHQHVLEMLHTNNDIFAQPITERLGITYALLGLTAYCLSSDPFADVKVPIIAMFMIFSLLLMAVMSDVLKDECGSVQEAVWRVDWLSAGMPTLKKMVIVTTRAQRYSRDGMAAAGMQERISMVTFVQVMRSSVSFLQALRNIH